jgi:hypothetical protein
MSAPSPLDRHLIGRDIAAAEGAAGSAREEIAMRFMSIVTSDQAAMPTPALMEAMHALAQREIKAGRMIADGGLAPLQSGARVSIKGGKVVVLDGPFIEAKEMIGGFAIFEHPDKDAAVASAIEFMELHRLHMPGWEGTCEVRAIAGSQTGAG